MNITKIISKTFDSRLKQIDLYASEASEIQHRVLNRLVQQASQTEWGKKYDYSSIRSYEDFRKRLPIQTYEEIKPYYSAFTNAKFIDNKIILDYYTQKIVLSFKDNTVKIEIQK